MKIQWTVRPAYFQATFWSVHRYIKDIAVFVATQKDADSINEWQLPYKFLTILKDTPLDFKNRTNMLPRDSLLHMMGLMRNESSSVAAYQYVYYSEGDQVLHMREAEVLYDAIDDSGGTFVVVPQRMQTLPAKQDFPGYLHHKWRQDKQAQNIPGLEIVVEDIHRARGSCCDDGDLVVEKCGAGWWYQCPDYGIRNMTTWLKFGSSGLTMPPCTEHQFVCKYHPERVQCPLPPDCDTRIPKRKREHTALKKADLCHPITKTLFLGPVFPAPTKSPKRASNVDEEEELPTPPHKSRETPSEEARAAQPVEAPEVVGLFGRKKSRKDKMRRRKGGKGRRKSRRPPSDEVNLGEE